MDKYSRTYDGSTEVVTHVRPPGASSSRRGKELSKLVFDKLREKSGTTLVFFSMILTALAVSAALVTDIGALAVENAKLSNAVDAAVLAAMRTLVEDPGAEQATAAAYMELHGYSEDDFQLAVNRVTNTLTVTATELVPFGLARLIGVESALANASAEGSILPISAISEGIRPFAIEEKHLVFDASYILKQGGGDGMSGNFGALALGGTGANNYRANIIEGYDGTIEIGDKVLTETGNMSGPTTSGVNALISQCTHSPSCTVQSYQPDCPRIITVVIVDSLDVEGRSRVTVVGFAKFFLTGVDGSGTNNVVRGSFVRGVASGETAVGQTSFGLYGTRLSR